LSNPLNIRNESTLQEQVNTIPFPDGSRIKYLAPNKPYKTFGVHINTVLNFRAHHTHNTKEVRKLATALGKRKLILAYKTLVVE